MQSLRVVGLKDIFRHERSLGAKHRLKGVLTLLRPPCDETLSLALPGWLCGDWGLWRLGDITGIEPAALPAGFRV